MKHETRRQIKRRLAEIPHAHAVERSKAIAEAVVAQPEFEAARVVMLYMTIPGEVDTAPLAHACWAAGKTVVCPKPCPDTKHMMPVICTPDQEEAFHPHHGLRSPAGSEILALSKIDLVIVPALGFDPKCNRLGRGGGFYDRFLAHAKMQASTIGIAFTEQILPTLPIHTNDRPVNMVVTDTDIYRINQ